MWLNLQALMVLIVPALWIGACIVALLFRKRLKGSAPGLRAAKTIVLVVCYLGIGEAVTGVVLQKIERPSSYSEPRNPHFIGDWVSYTSPKPEASPDYCVIVISNSQGFMRERPEGEWCYARLLEKKLRDSGYGENAKVLNWSIPGGGAMEFILLAARSVAHNPDAIILCSYNNDFSDYWNQQKLSKMSSDIANLAYLPEVRAQVPSRFLWNSSAYDLSDWLGSHSNMVAWHNWYTRKKKEWTFISREPGPRTELRVFKLESAVSGELIENVFLSAMGDDVNPEFRVVSMPLNGDQFQGFDSVQNFSLAATEVAKDWPKAEVSDATNLFPVEMFYGGRHMRPEAHRLFAQYLFDQLPPPGANKE